MKATSYLAVSRRSKLIIMSMFVLMLGGFLFVTSQDVQRKQHKLHKLELAIEAEKHSLRVLKAEWAYLNNPARLEKLVQSYLNMKNVVHVKDGFSDLVDVPLVKPPVSKPLYSKRYFKRASASAPKSDTKKTSQPKPLVKLQSQPNQNTSKKISRVFLPA